MEGAGGALSFSSRRVARMMMLSLLLWCLCAASLWVGSEGCSQLGEACGPSDPCCSKTQNGLSPLSCQFQGGSRSFACQTVANSFVRACPPGTCFSWDPFHGDNCVPCGKLYKGAHFNCPPGQCFLLGPVTGCFPCNTNTLAKAEYSACPRGQCFSMVQYPGCLPCNTNTVANVEFPACPAGLCFAIIKVPGCLPCNTNTLAKEK